MRTKTRPEYHGIEDSQDGGGQKRPFEVMRRTHSSLMNELEIDPKVVADQLVKYLLEGHPRGKVVITVASSAQ